MRVFALVGPSGTGKSHHALMTAKKNNIEAIVDDGLLISENKVVAGHSAKRERTKLASVKRALFMDKSHVSEVKKAMQANNIKSVLILGTSEEMTDRIAKALGLGVIERYINIEEVSSLQDIQIAKRMRNTQGKHIIPVPTFEIKKDFSGYFLHPLRILSPKQGQKPQVSDKTVVRPTYSYMGDYTISDNTIAQMVIHEAQNIDGVIKAYSVTLDNVADGVEINLLLSLSFGVNIQKVCKLVAESVTKNIDKVTALNISKVNITVKEIKKI